MLYVIWLIQKGDDVLSAIRKPLNWNTIGCFGFLYFAHLKSSLHCLTELACKCLWGNVYRCVERIIDAYIFFLLLHDYRKNHGLWQNLTVNNSPSNLSCSRNICLCVCRVYYDVLRLQYAMSNCTVFRSMSVLHFYQEVLIKKKKISITN